MSIPYGRQHIDNKDIAAVVGVLKSEWLTQGPKILEFEKALAGYCNSRYAVVVSSGTSALHLAYIAADLKRGDEVVTTPNTFVATTNMLIAVGAKPVFCDIRTDTRNIDEKQIEKHITKKTKAIIPVHFAGHPCDMNKVSELAKKYKLLIIEDACHALGAKYNNKKIGSFSDMTIFSFHPVKSITTGEGGAILTNSEKLYKKLIHLRSHGTTKNKSGFNVMTALGYNYRMNDIQAALGSSQLKKLGKFIKIRTRISGWYQKELLGLKDITLPVEIAGSNSAWHLYVIGTKNKKTREELAKYLKSKNIGVNFHYPAVYTHPYYRKAGYKNISLPNTENYYKTCLTLPLYPDLSRKEVQYICNQIKKFYGKN